FIGFISFQQSTCGDGHPLLINRVYRRWESKGPERCREYYFFHYSVLCFADCFHTLTYSYNAQYNPHRITKSEFTAIEVFFEGFQKWDHSDLESVTQGVLQFWSL
mgnify:CR=1